MEIVQVGLLGFGTVGSGVVRVLRDNAADIEGRLGARIDVSRIAVKHVDKKRLVEVPDGVLSGDPGHVIKDPNVKIVGELIGGVDDARELVLEAIRHGKHVVTANKALLAKCGQEIFDAASKKGVDVFYEAAVGGGIPIIRTLRESFASERVQSIAGILNGTTNFILTAMTERGAGFSEMLAEAQRLGYAEADPSADVDGHDAAQKLAILASLGFSTRVAEANVAVEGIRGVTAADIETAKAHGHAIKLLGVAERRGDAVAARVHPCWVPTNSMLAHVNGVLNAVRLESDALGTSMLLGQGAGELPTGSAVAADIINLARNVLLGLTGRVPHLATRDEALRPSRIFDVDEIKSAFYLRFSVLDTPGVLASIAGALGEHGVSLRVVEQHVQGETDGQVVPVVVITHEALGTQVRAAVQKIDAFETTVRETQSMRILADL